MTAPVRSFTFHPGPRLIAGPGSASRLGDLLPSGRCLFVTDAQVRSLGLADESLNSLERAGIEPIVFDEVKYEANGRRLILTLLRSSGAKSAAMLGRFSVPAALAMPSSRRRRAGESTEEGGAVSDIGMAGLTVRWLGWKIRLPGTNQYHASSSRE